MDDNTTIKDLAQRSIHSSAYSVFASSVQIIVGVIRMILLARLLDVGIFGVYTMIASYIGLTQAIPLFGMNQAMLHHADESDGDIALGTHQTLLIIFTSIWGLVLLLLSPKFIDSEYIWALNIYLGTQIITNLTGTNLTLLAKRVVFRRISLVQVTSSITGAVLAVFLAWKGFGLLSILSTDIVTSFSMLIGFYIFKPPWKPKLRWSTNTAKYLLGFGKKSLLATLFDQAINKIDNLWVGNQLGKTSLGYYSRAYTFSNYPRLLITNSIHGVAAGTYAELKGKRKYLTLAFFRVNAVVIRVAYILAGSLALIAPEFIHLIIGEKWLPMLLPFRLMLIYTMFDPVRGTIASLFIAVGKPEKTVHTRFIQLIVMILGLYTLGSYFGVEGVAVIMNIVSIIGISILLWHAKKFVDISAKKLFGIPTLALLSSMVFSRLAIQIPGVLGSHWRTAFVKLIVFVPLYIGILLYLERDQTAIYKEFVSRVFPSRQNIGKIFRK